MPDKKSAERILSNPESKGLSLAVATDILTGGAYAAWETETVLGFLESAGCLPGPEARERLLAVTAIRLNPAHLWDGFVFANLATALNGGISVPEGLEECSVGELAWAVVETRRISAHYGDEYLVDYGDEPSVYAAGVCAKAGLVVLPPELEFCKDAMDSMPSVENPEELRGRVLAKLAAPEAEIDEECPACTQAMVLREAGEYVRYHREQLDREIESLRA